MEGKAIFRAGPSVSMTFNQLPATAQSFHQAQYVFNATLPFPEVPPGELGWELESYQLVFSGTEPLFKMEPLYLPAPRA